MRKVSFKARWGRLCRFLIMSELKGFAYERRGNNPDVEKAIEEIFQVIEKQLSDS